MITAARRKPSTKGALQLPRKTPPQLARAEKIFRALEKCYPDAHCALHYSNPHELLVAVILSAQATDVSVNKVTPALFKAFPTPADYAAASPAAIEPYIRTIGLFRNKAKAVHSAMATIVEQFGGKVPATMDELLTLRGVARKTANVVLGNAFDRNDGVVVDTHVARVAHRLGLTKHTDTAKIERDLMALFPREHWTKLAHMLIFHGRQVCRARGATCAEHLLCREFCANARGRR